MPDNDSSEPPNHDALVVAARSNRAAFGRLYEAYYDRILSYCVRRLNRRSVAEDVCSETFLYVARKMNSFSGETEVDFQRWLFRIATNEVNAYLRRNLRRKELWDDALQQKRLGVAEAGETHAPDNEFHWQNVHRAISRLSPKQQSIVTLRLLEDMSHDEIARVMQTRSGTVRVIYSRAIKQLREWLQTDLMDSHDSSVR